MGSGASSAAVSPQATYAPSLQNGGRPAGLAGTVRVRRPSFHDVNNYDLNPPSDSLDKIECMDKTLVAMLTSIIERLFPDISGTFTADIIAGLKPIKLERGAVLVKQNECSDNMYIVESGSLVKIHNADRYGTAPVGFIVLPEATTFESSDEYFQGMVANRHALCLDFPASATLAASCECMVWALSRLVFKSTQKRAVSFAMGKCANRLCAIEDFDSLSEYKLGVLANSFAPVSFANGECLATQGNPTNRIIIVESGFIQVEVDGEIVTDLGSLQYTPPYASSRSPTVTVDGVADSAPASPVAVSDQTSNYIYQFDILKTGDVSARLRAQLEEASRALRQLSRKASNRAMSSKLDSSNNSAVGGSVDGLKLCPLPSASSYGDGSVNSGNSSNSVTDRMALIYPGCVLGMSVLRGRQGRAGSWEYVCYANQFNQTVYGFKCPFTLRALGKVRALEVTIQTFEAKVCKVATLVRMGSPMGRNASAGLNLTAPAVPRGRSQQRRSSPTPASAAGSGHENTLSNTQSTSKRQMVAFQKTDSAMDMITTSLRSAGLSLFSSGHKFRTFERMNCLKVLKSTPSGSLQTVYCSVQDPLAFFVDSKAKGRERDVLSDDVGFYVMKVYNKASVVAENLLAKVLNEAEHLASVDNPFVSKLVWQFQTANSLCLVVDAVECGDLFHLLNPPANESLFESGLTQELVQYFCASVLLALRHLHSMCLVYRNLKPENVLIDGRGMIKLVGLDLCKKLPSDSVFGGGGGQFRAFTLCGCPEYLAPEQVLDSGHDTCVDMWALGVLAHELFLTYTPFMPGFEVQSGMMQPADHRPGGDSASSSLGLGRTKSGCNDVDSLLTNIVSVQNNHFCLRNRAFNVDGSGGSELKSFIEDLLLFNPHDRLVAGRGSSSKYACFHVFFENFDWDALESCQYAAMYVPFRKMSQFRVAAGEGSSKTGMSSQWSASGSIKKGNGTHLVIDESPAYVGDQGVFSAF